MNVKCPSRMDTSTTQSDTSRFFLFDFNHFFIRRRRKKGINNILQRSRMVGLGIYYVLLIYLDVGINISEYQKKYRSL